jgi:hypothetical protein
MNSHAIEFLARDHLAELHRDAQAARLAGAAAAAQRSGARERWATGPERLLAFARELATASRRRRAARESR